MRKLFVNNVILLTLITSVLLVSSCEKKEEIIEADLIGIWDIGQASVDIKVGPLSLFDFLISTLQFGQEAAQQLVDEYTSEFIEIGGGTIAFNEDYSYLMHQSELEESGTWKLESDLLYMTITGETQDDDPLTVESLNSSAALVVWEEEMEISLGEDMNEFTATIIIELNLSKQ
ncbi:MAG: hypothetical protein DRJ29_04170 [Bacteroidetes bacterium]|nr:MAG: hypothetical protein DRJ29_04170 [Bacteroidota bacterium]